MAALIDCRKLVVGYGGVPMLPCIEVDIEPGVFCCVVGRNGSGKSTWFKTVLGLIPPVSGEVIHKPGLRIAYIPQRLAYDAIYPLTVREVVSMGLLKAGGFLGIPRIRDGEIQPALESVDAWKLRAQIFHSLSEGQKQRVLFARALVADPEVAFMDEPTAAMDVVAQREMLMLVDCIRRERKMAVVMVNHELSVATHYAEQVFLVDRTTNVVVSGTAREVFSSPTFAELYGQEKANDLMKELEHVECDLRTAEHKGHTHDHDHDHGSHA
ncbi:MAG: metal ABC transporter ATP-binding protein [Deltaproteobacteria bacterium]|nr:metal ABC transporter ATP-binding protein [Deltaproteobacteria bacterium]